MNKPTVGRIVHVVTWYGTRAAIIANVWNDTCVDLHIFYTKQDWASALVSGARLEADVTSAIEGTLSGNWFWPPRA